MVQAMRWLAWGIMGLAVACAPKPPAETVVLVGRGLNPAWATLYRPVLATPGRELRFVDVADTPLATTLQPWWPRRERRLVLVPLALSAADPVAVAIKALEGTRANLALVAPPEADALLAAALAQRGLQLSRRRSQEGLFILMDLPSGADRQVAEATVTRMATAVSRIVDFRPVRGLLWEGPLTAGRLKREAGSVLHPLVITYTTTPGPLNLAVRDHVHGFRYAFDGEGMLNDPGYREWLRQAVGLASLSAASPPKR